MKHRIAILSCICAMLCMIFASDTVIKCSSDALRLCIEVIVPSLLPFIIVTSLLRRLGFMQWLGEKLQRSAGKLFGCSGEGASAFILGLLGGYPLGAASISSMLEQGRISSDEAERLLAFCNNSGPAFIIGTVGAGVFDSASKGCALYVIHILSALICGVLLRGKTAHKPAFSAPPPNVSVTAAFTDSVKEALQACLNVCGFIICFSVLSAILDLFGAYYFIAEFVQALTGIDEKLTCALLTGFLEIGSGAGALIKLSDSPGAYCCASFILGFGGLSVHCQSAALFADTEVHFKKHFFGKLLCGVLSAVITFVYINII